MRNFGPIAIAILILAVVGGALAASGTFRKPTPTFLADAGYSPSDLSEHDGWWYWIERAPKTREKLFRARPGTKEPLAEADRIAGYDASGDTVVWSARSGTRWSVARSQAGRDETLWAGTDVVGAPSLSGDAVLWAVTKPGTIKDNVTLPALGPRTELMVSRPGAAPKSVCSLLEAGCDVAGVHGDSAYAVCARSGGEGQTAGYEISLSSGAARRVFGEGGIASAILLPGGELIWTAPSRDSSIPERVACVRSLSPGVASVTRADWLPSDGQLFVSGDRTYYVGGSGSLQLWSLTTNDALPRQLETPPDFNALAAGGGATLLSRPAGKGSAVGLYTWHLR
jgi:hypothetical protein